MKKFGAVVSGIILTYLFQVLLSLVAAMVLGVGEIYPHWSLGGLFALFTIVAPVILPAAIAHFFLNLKEESTWILAGSFLALFLSFCSNFS